jgi:putative hydrolase of HD superfamily
LPGVLAEPLHELHGEYGDSATREARLAHDADRLECLLQAREYAVLGVSGADVFARNALARLASPTARELGERCLAMDPDAWWQEAVAPVAAAAAAAGVPA